MSRETVVISAREVRQPKNGLTWEEKVKICEDWRCSRLSKVMYCKRNSLIFSTFCGWCNSLWPKGKTGRLCEVSVLELSHKREKVSPITIELSISNQISAKVSMREDQILNFFKGVIHASSTSW